MRVFDECEGAAFWRDPAVTFLTLFERSERVLAAPGGGLCVFGRSELVAFARCPAIDGVPVPVRDDGAPDPVAALHRNGLFALIKISHNEFKYIYIIQPPSASWTLRNRLPQPAALFDQHLNNARRFGWLTLRGDADFQNVAARRCKTEGKSEQGERGPAPPTLLMRALSPLPAYWLATPRGRHSLQKDSPPG